MSAGVRAKSDDSERSASVIVAHPDDETLWAGGMILTHPNWRWRIVSQRRGDEPDRSAKFYRVVTHYGGQGAMGVLDDGPDQVLLSRGQVESTVLALLEGGAFDVVVTHSPAGEYTRHRRHEETGLAVGALWLRGAIRTKQLWMFAYDDDEGNRLPEAIDSADRVIDLPEGVWREKYRLITEVYGFPADGFEARTVPRVEGFWCFDSAGEYEKWLTEVRSKL